MQAVFMDKLRLSFPYIQKDWFQNQCHVDKLEFLKLKGKSSDLLLKNIWEINFSLS